MFLDDLREPSNDGKDWLRFKSSSHAIGFMMCHGLPDHISFDHDLGGPDTAMVVVNWLMGYLVDEDRGRPFTYYVHSQNPVGKRNIEAAWDSFDRMYTPFVEYNDGEEG